MTTRLLLSCVLLAAAPAVWAQERLAFMQTATGELTATDKTLQDKSLYDEWTFGCAEGGRVVVTMKADFDAYLHLGRYDDAGTFTSLDTDDDSGGGTNAQISFVLDTPGEYVVRANALREGMTGAYSLDLEGKCAQREDITLSTGVTIDSWLGGTDARADDRFYEDWNFRGQGGDRIVITMEAPTLDGSLQLYRGRGAASDPLVSDDDGGGRTNARIEITLPATGDYTVRATTPYARKSGEYTIRISPPLAAVP